MPMDSAEIEELIKAAIPDAQVTIKDLRGDGDQYAAEEISKTFAGITRIPVSYTHLTLPTTP